MDQSKTPSSRDADPPASAATVTGLFLLCLKIGALSFGGGLSGWIFREFVMHKRWITEDDFLSSLTIAQLLPGANVVNLVIFLGEQLRGPVGALTCLVGFILPPILATLGLLLLLAALPQSSILDAAMTGVAFSALGMMIQIGWVGLRRIIRAPTRLAITGAVALAIIVLQLPVVGVVLVAAPIAILVAWVTRHG